MTSIAPIRSLGASRLTHLVLMGVVILGAALRLYHLDAQSLWYDEVITWLAARRPVTSYLWTSASFATVHALYFAIVHGVLVLGDDEYLLRLPSFVLGTASIPLLYLVARPWLGRGVALGAAALMAVSPFHVYYSQEARPYAALLCFGLVSLACVEGVRDGRRPLLWGAGAVLGIAAMLYTHPVAIFFVPVLVLVPLLRGGSWPTFRWLAVSLAALALAAPALARIVLYPPLRTTNPVEFVGLTATPYLFWTFVAGYSLGPSVRELHGTDRWDVALAEAPLIVPIAVLVGGLALAGAASIRRGHGRLLLLVAAWLLLPIAAITIFSPLTRQPLNARYAILAFPALLVLVAAGTEALPGRRWRAGVWVALLAVSGVALANYYHAGRYQREDYRAAVAALRSEALPGDLVLVTAPYTVLMLRYYDPGPVEVAPYPDKGPEEPGIAHRTTTRDWGFWRSELERRIEGRSRFWVLLSRTWRHDPEGRLVPYLDSRYARGSSGSWAGTRLILYEIPERSTATGRRGGAP